MLKREIAHGMGHGTQCSDTTFTFYVVLNSSAKSLISLDCQYAPDFWQRRNLIGEVHFLGNKVDRE
jgi:hypothetical protein